MKFLRLSQRDRVEFLDELDAMSDHLTEVFANMTASDSRRAGPNGSFSPLEHVWHLVDLEKDGFAVRIRRLQTETQPVLPDFDGELIAKEGNYNHRSLQEGLARFRAARSMNVSALKGLSPESWLRSGEQVGVGPVSLGDIPGMMAEHDEDHRAEIAEWIRANRPAPRRGARQRH